MPYTRTSLAFLWVVILALFVLAGSGAVAGPWLLLLIALALAAPAVVLRNSVRVTAPVRERGPELR